MEAGQGIETTRSNWVFDEKVAPKLEIQPTGQP